MRKSDIIDMGKHLARNYFLKYRDVINENDVSIIGLKEYDNMYVMIFALEGEYDILCRMFYNINNRKIKTEMFKRIGS